MLCPRGLSHCSRPHDMLAFWWYTRSSLSVSTAVRPLFSWPRPFPPSTLSGTCIFCAFFETTCLRIAFSVLHSGFYLIFLVLDGIVFFNLAVDNHSYLDSYFFVFFVPEDGDVININNAFSLKTDAIANCLLLTESSIVAVAVSETHENN